MNIVILGRRYQGKSTLARFLSRRIQQRRHAHVVAIFDPKRTFKNIPHASDPEVFEDLLEMSGAEAVAFQPPARTDEGAADASEQFDIFYDALGVEFHLGEPNAPRKNLAPFILVVDEAWQLRSGGSVNSNLANLIRLADHENFFLIQVGHRPVDFDLGMRSQVDELYIFKQWLPDDLKILRDWCGEDVARQASQLPDHHVIRYDINSGIVEYWNKPEGWNIDIKGEPHERTERTESASGPEAAIT